MSRRAPRIRPRRPILGCEGSSENGYGALLDRLARDIDALHLHIHHEILQPGAGDPLALVQRAIERIANLQRRRATSPSRPSSSTAAPRRRMRRQRPWLPKTASTISSGRSPTTRDFCSATCLAALNIWPPPGKPGCLAPTLARLRQGQIGAAAGRSPEHRPAKPCNCAGDADRHYQPVFGRSQRTAHCHPLPRGSPCSSVLPCRQHHEWRGQP